MEDINHGRDNIINLNNITQQGKSATWKKIRRALAYSTVGSLDYIAPNIFLQIGYGTLCDFWSLGAVIFVCLCGYIPFCAENPHVHTVKL
jgi:protein-serine/threonine kinase